ncbi:hypothetical protein EX30DRAFT_343968 [Ascodesmis nigricans]|uniref:Branched-chain-amino-acid aminotransferase n=1 Tax=Ascodesmis nigricans TaxID=341454 RepID=A0A4S2MRJ7_9PEZI|nr:hypothetical protein EX30DRAFT_343968 [Ascodesmis nigricans]
MAPPAPTSLTDIAVEQVLSKANTTAGAHPAKPVSDGWGAETTTKEPTLRPLDPTLLTTTLTTSPKPYGMPTNWGKEDVTTDHMIICNWNSTTGWSAPRLQPYQRMDLFPTASCLHYATECFEGLKAYRGMDGKLRLFRPSRNCARMLTSSTRIALPTFPPEALESLIKSLLAIDGKKWVPTPGSFLYIRPTMIGTGRALGVQKPVEASLFIVMTLFPRLDKKPMKLLASSEDTIRAWPGGFGSAKVGANYGPSLMAQKMAVQRGYDQILWLFGENALVTEAGASNFFVVLKEAGKTILLTAPLEDKIILDGVTRRSIIELAKERLGTELEVVERKYTMHELVAAKKEGRFVEAFAAGTAFFVAPVVAIEFRGEKMEIEMRGEEGVATRVKKWLTEIMWGEVQHEWGVVIEEKKWEAEVASEKEVEELKEKMRELMKGRAWLRALEELKLEKEEKEL